MRFFNHYILPILWILANVPTALFGGRSLVVDLLWGGGIFMQVLYVVVSTCILFIFLLITRDNWDSSNRLLLLSGFAVMIFSLVSLAKTIALVYAFSLSAMLSLLEILIPLVVLAILLLVLYDWLIKR